MRSNQPPGSLEAEELARLRTALLDAIDRKSLRSVAREISMSATGLRGVLNGATPYVKTWDKLRVWFAAGYDVAASQGDLPALTVERVMRRILRKIPEREQWRAQVRVLNAVEEAHRAAGVDNPPWLADVRRLVQSRG